MDNKARVNEPKQYADMRKFVLIFTYNGILYDATIKDISYPDGNYFSVEFSYGQKKGFIPKLHCIDPVKLKWDSEDFIDKAFCQTVGHAIALFYKKQYLLLQNK